MDRILNKKEKALMLFLMSLSLRKRRKNLNGKKG